MNLNIKIFGNIESRIIKIIIYQQKSTKIKDGVYTATALFYT